LPLLRLLLPVLRLLLMLRCLRFLLPAPAPAARASARLLRRGEVLRQRVRDLVQGAELLAGGIDQLVRARGVALRRGEERGTDLERLLPRRVDELRRVFLVPVAARVGERAQQPLCLRKLGAGPPILDLPRGAGEPPGPAGEDLLG